jgi:hypothetical protein
LAMLTGLGIPHGTDPDVLLRTYAVAVHGIREDAILETCGKYIRGEVEGHKKGRAPTTDLFTSECRSWANTKGAVERKAKRQLPPPQEQEIPLTPEQRTAMKEKLTTWRRAMAGDTAAQHALRKHGWSD